VAAAAEKGIRIKEPICFIFAVAACYAYGHRNKTGFKQVLILVVSNCTFCINATDPYPTGPGLIEI